MESVPPHVPPRADPGGVKAGEQPVDTSLLPCRLGRVVDALGHPTGASRAISSMSCSNGAFDVEMSGTHVRIAERMSFFGEVALLVDVPRTAIVTASSAGSLLAIDRVRFLTTVTGTDSSRHAARGVARALTLEHELIPSESFGGNANDAAAHGCVGEPAISGLTAVADSPLLIVIE